MEIGIDSFASIETKDVATGEDRVKAMQDLINRIVLADKVGLDYFGVGEHHKSYQLDSVPSNILSAAAVLTKNIRLSSAVTVLSADDPVRVFQQFSTLDLISNGRAEIVAGRGSSIEAYPLFGYNLNDYDALFEEKLDLLLKINNEENVSWSGKLRAPMQNQTVYPRAFNNGVLPIWIAVGGTPESVLRAAKLGLPLIVAIIGGMPRQFKNLIDFYKQEYLRAGHDESKMQIAIHSHTFVSDDQNVIDQYFFNYKSQMDRIGRTRGWAPYTKEQYEGGRSKEGALFIGTANEVADKINEMKELFGLTRFIGHMDVGDPAHDVMMKSIQLFGDKIAPQVK